MPLIVSTYDWLVLSGVVVAGITLLVILMPVGKR
jgi:hypothetical protein